MKSIIFSSRSEKKLDLLVQVARELGVKVEPQSELTDENMALPGPKVSAKQFTEWLVKDDGNAEYTSAQMKSLIRKTARKRKGS